MNDQLSSPSNTRFYRMTLLMVLALLIVGLTGSWLLHYLRTGTLAINTSDKSNSIQISKINGSTTLKQGQGHLLAKLPTGEYVAVVSGRTASTKQIVIIKAHQINSYTINVQSLIEAEPVLPFGAYGVQAGGSQTFYADMRDHLLYKVRQDGQPTAVDDNIQFSKILWQDENYGVGVNLDNSRLYSIKNGVISQINLPFTTNKLDFDMAPNGQLVVSNGRSIYLVINNSVKNLFTARTQISALAFSGQDILAGISMSGKSNNDESTFRILNLQGQAVASRQTSAYSYAWSPSGNYLAMTNDSSTIVYDAHFKIISTLPDGNVLGMTWQDNDTLLYGVGPNLFSYKVKTGSSAQIAALPGNHGVSGIYPSRDGTQIYILDASSTSTSQSYKLARVNLGKKVPDYIYQLGLFLPIQLGQCYADYTNFSHFLVAVLPPSSAAATSCIQATQSYLIQDQIDVSQLGFYIDSSQ